MKVKVMAPYRLDKNLGRAYNEAMNSLEESDWGCLIDYDVMFLTPDAIKMMHEYAARYPDAGMLTCYTNRIHPSSPQLLGKAINENTDMNYHIETAERMRKFAYRATPVYKNISGFLMLISKRTWHQVKFNEGLMCLGVDTDYWKRLSAAGMQILRMDALYVFHLYRLKKGIQDKQHLL